MIRSDILQVKTSHVSAEHRREVLSLGRIREREDRARLHVQQREQRFWREIARAATDKAHPQRGSSPTHRDGSLERALEAHHLLKAAKDQHAGASKELRTQLSKVMRTKLAVDTFTKLQRKDRLHREHQRVERAGEQVEEAFALRATRHPSRSRRATTSDHMETWYNSAGEGPRLEGRSQPGVPTVPWSQTPDRPVTASDSSHHEVPLTEGLSIRSMGFEARASTPSLIVNVEHHGTPVACHFREAPCGEVGVVIGTSLGSLSERIGRQRAGIVNKLSELGIKISTLEVKQNMSLTNSFGGTLKRGRRTREERDENTLS